MSGMYDPLDWKLTFGGILITGFVTGSFLKVMHRTPAATTIIGADGEGTFVVSHDRSGQCEFTLRREVSVNLALSAKLNLVRRGSRLAIGPLFVENVRTKSTAKATNAILVKSPDMEGATDYTPIIWTLEAIKLDMFNGAAEFSGVG
ncbi:MAG: hypothetical protein ACRCU1_18395 [Alsobacter sp.]